MDWEPPSDWPRIETVDSHAGGEPLRLVVDGFPEIPGETILDKRRYVKENLDGLRKALMWEPRGHADMYGAIPTEPTTENGDLGILFTTNEGYSTMCGHGVIALGVVLPEIGMIDLDPEDPTIKLDTPAGRVTARPRNDTEQLQRAAFENVPSFVVKLNEEVDVPPFGSIQFDVAFGGAYYAYCEAAEFGVSLEEVEERELVNIGQKTKAAISEDLDIQHPTDDDLAFLYGVILTDRAQGNGDIRNVCIFADGQIDRSPTGTGVSGHLALKHSRNELEQHKPYVVESVVGSTFAGRILETIDFHGYDAVVPQVEGEAHITGTSVFTIDPNDPFPEGFILRK